MKNLAKIIGVALIMTAYLTVFTGNVYAEGLNVTADKESCEIGDKITVTVEADGIGDGVVPPAVKVEFNANRLNFESCSVDYGGGAGGLVTFNDKSATIEFTTLSGGNADINVTATPDEGGDVTGSVTVSVNGEDTAAAMEEATTSATGIEQGTIDAGDGRVIQTVFAEEFKPVYFHKETTDYKGQSVECAKFDMGDIILLYTTDATGADGKFMVYNPSTQELTDFRMIQGIENRFIIVLSDCEGPIPAGYTKAVLEWSGQTLTAFMEEDVAAGTAEFADGINPADFFLVYAISSEGNKGWYRYDKNEGTYQRFLNRDGFEAGGEGDDDESSDGDSKGILDDYIPGNIQSIIALVCAPLAFILLIVVIILAVKLRDYADDYYEDDYYEDEEEDEDDYYEQRRAKSGTVTAASLVGKQMADDDEEDEDEEEDEDDEEEDDEDAEEVDEGSEEEDDDEEEEEDDPYDRPLTRKERKELEREEKWRRKEEKKAAKRRAQGYEEATPLDWSSFEKGKSESEDKPYAKSKPPKYMTESLAEVRDAKDEEDAEEETPKQAPLPPRKKRVVPEEAEEQPHVMHEKEQREKQRRLFEQQQRIEEQRRIEKEQLEAQQASEQKKFIQSRTEDLDLDEDFQFEFLKLD